MEQGRRLSWSDLQCLARRKPASSTVRAGAGAAAVGGNGRSLAKALSVPHLMAIGVGSTIGAGIYVLPCVMPSLLAGSLQQEVLITILIFALERVSLG